MLEIKDREFGLKITFSDGNNWPRINPHSEGMELDKESAIRIIAVLGAWLDSEGFGG